MLFHELNKNNKTVTTRNQNAHSELHEEKMKKKKQFNRNTVKQS